MWVQSIPVVCLMLLLFTNVKRCGRLCSAESVVLGIEAIAFLSAVFYEYTIPEKHGGVDPRLDAMTVLALVFVILNLPLVIFSTGNSDVHEVLSVSKEQLSGINWLINIMLFMLAISLVVNMESVIQTIREMSCSVEGERFNKDELRMANDQVKTAMNIGVWLATPAKPVIFFCLYGWLTDMFSLRKTFLLMVLSLAGVVVVLKDGGRAGLVQTGLFFLVSSLCIRDCLKYKKINKKIFQVFLLVVIAFCAVAIISFLRFPEEGFEQMIHYIAAGPFFFNVDYTVMRDCNLSPLIFGCGSISFPLFGFIMTKISGLSYCNPGLAFKEDEFWASVYENVAGSVHVEFKTIAGSLLIDFGWSFGLIIVAIVVVYCMLKMRSNGLEKCLLHVIYLYILTYAVIGFAFAGPFGNIELIWLLLVYVALARKRLTL